MLSIPCARIGTIDFPSGLSGLPDSPSMVGMLGPYTSASSTPTRAPSAASARARFTAVVDLPTPPLPEPTAMMLRIEGSGESAAWTARAWTMDADMEAGSPDATRSGVQIDRHATGHEAVDQRPEAVGVAARTVHGTRVHRFAHLGRAGGGEGDVAGRGGQRLRRPFQPAPVVHPPGLLLGAGHQ